MTIAIYELERMTTSPLVKDDAYEATGIVHFYCSLNHAERHAIAEGYRTSANFSKPEPADESGVDPQTVCEWCGERVA